MSFIEQSLMYLGFGFVAACIVYFTIYLIFRVADKIRIGHLCFRFCLEHIDEMREWREERMKKKEAKKS